MRRPEVFPCWFEDVRLGECFALADRAVGNAGDPFQLLAGSAGNVFAGSAAALLSQCSRFVQAADPGDQLFTVLQVVALQPGESDGVVVLRSTIHNQLRKLLMEGEQHYRLHTRPMKEDVPGTFWNDTQQRCAAPTTH